ncbi:fluoride efflux transporter CrcB [Bacillus aquiflavi]|uniref:Fluoride-specific ion channel FluC n=1 Tax=Bacillus aquiflavi TaxID=2672567 RepID=A0A6B3VXU1_9BACI|nr:fluoride efflux transporter CrcB [Bacillus aquiflavi]MBA4535971.1 fluoride efflux transporter CrcB [Bacillus aquiflavi]NEY80346.1 fluoride efflux transporter CrcB [Bacillus aquiflavi]UAC49792.1 fluoride efflux transporter CrcB [Bacillus aquiflavi]
MNEIIAIGMGGFFGAMTRFAVSNWFSKKNITIFPLGTLTVNLIGSFLLGLVISFSLKMIPYAFFATGFLGAFTTFSTVNLEFIQLFEKREKKLSYQYIYVTYIGGIICAFLGLWLGSIIL